MSRGLRAFIVAGVWAFSACGVPSPEPPRTIPLGAQSTLVRVIDRPSSEQIVLGCVPCAIYSIDINGRRAAFARASDAGRLVFRGALRPRDKVTLTLYRRFPCAS
jgi:hypothetical protein